MYAQMTGQTREQIIKDLDRDNYMSAQQALEYGLIDKIVTSVDGP
jgi:ATP-dependent Clp protease protease subunit